MRTILIAVSSVFFMMSFYACIPYDRLVNYKVEASYLDSVAIRNAPDIRIQPGDVLKIQVYGPDETTIKPYNLSPGNGNDNFTSIASVQLSGYLVDQRGVIDFPVIGEMKLGGLTTTEAKNLVKSRLLEDLKDVVVNLRLLNFQVTVSGEVQRPGSFFVVNERITLPEALTQAGDMTNYADRSNVLIVREVNGVRTFNRVNLQSSNLFQSDMFYLKQNDFIYVEPITAKTGAVQDQSNKTLPIITATATLIAVAVSILRK
ncbi:MAG: polysaccharide biosynthesis/export family protein [Saprospiraceae bacterium]|nr:polysaccharide biosynthesis/export family protein [Lewinella sp.]